MPILEGERVSKYFGGLAAVSRVDFSVERGMIFGLIGPNGAGKTTLFNLISASLVPKTGIIRFKGRDITGLTPHKICRLGVARTFQTVKIFQNMRVLENVVLGVFFGSPAWVSSARAARDAEEILDVVGLLPARETPARDLTLASQKRLEVARALATRPELLLLDEIMAGLTPMEVAQAMELVNRIRDRGITIVMIEHVMKAVMNMCDRLMVLDHGQKIAEGTPQEIAVNKKVIEVYLGE
ncbi:MAG: ABC transporter ATP-binding protein [Deltaproteobacteria bacterium]|nr:ABC transporter ATP-binding protein [Deltaproteobacteria bacterium]